MPPRTQLELALAEIWAEVVGAPCDDVRDDFFRSGGDSIGAASLIARASSRLGVGVDLGEFVAEPTIAALAARIGRVNGHRSAASSASTAALDGAPARCSYAQERFYFIDLASASGA